jgi:hypothetical protein
MNPGAITRPVASITFFAAEPSSAPISAIRSPSIPISPLELGAFVPSTISPFWIKMSSMVAPSEHQVQRTSEVRCTWTFSVRTVADVSILPPGPL